MERMELIKRYLAEKHTTTMIHEQYLSTQREYAPGTSLYMREIHFIVAVDPEKPVSISYLAEQLDVTLGATSQMASRLEKKGYITRFTDPENRRRTLVQLTEDGQRLYRQHQEYDSKRLLLLSEMFASFTDSELQRMIEAEQIFQHGLRDVSCRCEESNRQVK